MEKYQMCYIFLFLATFCHTAEIYKHNDKTELHSCVTMILQGIQLDEITDVTLINVNAELGKALHSLSYPMRYISRTFYWPNDTVFNDVYIIRCQNYSVFARGLDSVRRDPFWNPHAKFIIIIEDLEDNLQDVSNFLTHNHIYNVALVSSDYRNVSVYSFGDERDECQRPGRKKLEKLLSPCSEIDDVIKTFSTNTTNDLRGCRVHFVSHEYWPFVSFASKYAVENYLLMLIRKYAGITVDLVNFGTVENHGECLKNFTYTGMLHEIETYHVEGAIGGYSLTLGRMINLDFIDPYMVNSYKIIIPRARLLSMWSAIRKQFGVRALWIIFALFCFLCVQVTVMRIFKKRVRDTSRDILIVWGYFLNNVSQKKVKSGASYKIVLLNMLLYIFIISCATQASLLSATTHPIRDYQPNTAEEVISDYQFIISPDMYAHLKVNPVIDISNVITPCKTSLDCMMQVMQCADQPLFTIASDVYHESNIWKFTDKYGDLKIHTLREPLGTILQTMYLRRGSPLVVPFNRMLGRIRSAGLIDKFLTRIHFSERLKYKFKARKQRKPRKLQELRGVFMIFIYGCFVSITVFVLEYLISIILVLFYTN
ncbi:uncharacterized protein LOC125237982 [Leguminivora glycinivorella]|uniref:uncharacterized protein LOC125237982 n=1 Tax=Leguminivora glycinivorella TaxID=1035111 RepID=UPI00200E5DFF|nr:uncharacterized protein LOC125237982 [Leguminivora glycinivorella]